MKLITVFILAGFLQVSANIYSQNANIRLDVKTSSLADVIQNIQEQTEFIFFFSPVDIEGIEVTNVELEKATLEKALETCLKGTALTYEIKHNAVILKRKPQQEPTDSENLNVQPRKKLTGTIKDEAGAAIPGATIIVKGTTVGTISNFDGNFTLEVPDDAKAISVSFVGFETQELSIADQTVFNIVLKETTIGLDEVVAIGYGTQRKITTTGSLSTVKTEDILKAPVANVSNSLTGIMPGLTVVNRTGRIGKNETTIRLRGIGTMSGEEDPLILVDGMERPMNDIDANEIESVTVLKDASSTAVFGVRGANGVILVTTKRGKDGPAKVSFSSEFGLATPTRKPEFLDSYEYSLLYNEAQINDGVAPSNVKYSDEAIEHYRTGDDPWLYPNTDWYDMVIRDVSPQQRYNLNITGGTKSTKYFASVGYLEQHGIYKNFNNGYDNSDWMKRYNFRSNLDFDITKDLTVSVGLGGTIKSINMPNEQRANDANAEQWFVRWIMAAPPMAGPGWIDGKSYIDPGYKTPIEWMTAKGYRNDYNSEVNTLFSVKQKLGFITKGLSARAKYGYDSNYTINLRRKFTTKQPEYIPKRLSIDQDGDGVNEDVLLFKERGSPSVLNYVETSDGKRRHVYFEAALDWNRTFNNDHDVTGLLLYNQSKKYYMQSSFNEIPLSYMGFVSRFTYSYKSKYNAEINMGYNGSENFPKGKRFGFFPSYSASWVASEEAFMRDVKFISFLKFKASYGLAGNDRLGSNRFLYIPDSYSMSFSGGPKFGVDGSGQGYGTASLTKHGNPEVSWEIDEKQNYAVEVKLFDKLSINVDYFRNYRTNILRSKSTYPAYVDEKIPPVNFGKMSNHGYEIEATWRVRKGDFSYWLKGIYAFARNKVIEMDEPTTIPDWQKQTGRPLGRPVIYLVKGFYNTQEEVDAANGVAPIDGIAVNEISKVRKGDLWYEDYNEDGVINDLDRVSYGNYTKVPEVSASLSLGASYKGFDFSVLFQGVTHTLVSYSGEALQPFTSQYTSPMSAQTFVRGRWTEETKETATFPALTLVPAHYNFGSAYGYVNEFFTNDGSYVRLKNLEIGYSFTNKLLEKVKCKSLRVYVNGSNLITWDKQKLFKFDPEQPGGRFSIYPQLKVYNVGLNLQF